MRRRGNGDAHGAVRWHTPAGVAHGIAERMREARARRVATAGGPPPAPVGDPRVGEIERLAGLRDSGALTEEEFAAEKARVLGSG